jgi:hypothetical protein
MNQCPPGPQVFHWGQFEFFRKLAAIRKLIFITGVNDTSDKLFSSVNDNGEKLAGDGFAERTDFYRHYSLSLVEKFISEVVDTDQK